MPPKQFIDALRLFLDTADSVELDKLVTRLQPYRIQSLHVQRPEGTAAIPMLCLDEQAGASTPNVDDLTYFGFGLSSGATVEDTSHETLNFLDDQTGGYCDMELHDLHAGEMMDLPMQKGSPLGQQNLPITPPDSDYFDLFTTSPETIMVESGNETNLGDKVIHHDQGKKIMADNGPATGKRKSTDRLSSTARYKLTGKSTLGLARCIRSDYLDFLAANLTHWIKEGLWMPLTSSQLKRGRSSYGFLENIYSCVTKLDTRIEYDQIRKRIALVLLHSQYLESYRDWKMQEESKRRSFMAVGRGDMSLMIDNILQQTTPGWSELDVKRRSQLRALFHERKRYGKRWSVFKSELGPGILLLCSVQLANMTSNTKVTMASLREISRSIRACDAIMEVLKILDPLAESLINNDGYGGHDKDQILERVNATARLPSGGNRTIE